MRHAEELYQQGFISYPRTETDQFEQSYDLRVGGWVGGWGLWLGGWAGVWLGVGRVGGRKGGCCPWLAYARAC